MSQKPLEKILYAEDDPSIQTIARMSLETVGGFELVVCNDGNEVLEQLRNYTPDLILLDVMMPNKDGPGALVELRKIAGMETVPVIFMTAKIMPENIDSYKKMGVVEVISKPFDPMALPGQIREIWDGLDG